jgi:hypothetical protein
MLTVEQGPIEKSTRKAKKFMRLVRAIDETGKVIRKKTVHFGDPNMTIKKDDPAHQRSYCARSAGIAGAGDPFSANYQSRQMWDCDALERKLPKALP